MMAPVSPISLKAPKGLKRTGRALWTAVMTEFELGTVERILLLQLARCADRCDALDSQIRSQGIVRTLGGMPHPAVAELRQTSILYARLLSALRLPDQEDVRPQRRSSRGVYQWRRPQVVR